METAEPPGSSGAPQVLHRASQAWSSHLWESLEPGALATEWGPQSPARGSPANPAQGWEEAAKHPRGTTSPPDSLPLPLRLAPSYGPAPGAFHALHGPDPAVRARGCSGAWLRREAKSPLGDHKEGDPGTRGPAEENWRCTGCSVTSLKPEHKKTIMHIH